MRKRIAKPKQIIISCSFNEYEIIRQQSKSTMSLTQDASINNETVSCRLRRRTAIVALFQMNEDEKMTD